MGELAIFICKNIGVSGTTECHVRPMADGRFEARMGFALLGTTNMSKAQFKACNYDQFSDQFYDNAASGIGNTQDEAIEAMKADLEDAGNSLWT